ncbi:hypothetical protein TL08_20825 [Actinoalloteichus hymeniacidonis]|uniref:Uncharacterized protein n=2 Tax=Actinoalloteichus hymeniacidonis TaxID=340345 RepID=A0AAC9HU54_9PSEU|nr:hypothetical protein TL08_20825 [Actinoalloteichus hymeniacidonis]
MDLQSRHDSGASVLASTGRIVSVFAGGLAVGVGTFFGQGSLPALLSQALANSGASWSVATFLLVAFLVAAGPWSSAIAGILAMVGMVLGYYGTATIVLGTSGGRWMIIWLLVALVAGPVFGLAGYWWRVRRPGFEIAGIALLGGVYLEEAGRILLSGPQDYPFQGPGWLALVIGVGIPLLLGRSWRNRGIALVAALPVALLIHFVLMVLLPG